MDVRDRADRRAGVAADALLVYYDRRREVLDGVRVRLTELGQTVTDERRKRLVELPLGLGGQGVEDQRRLARTRNPGEDRDRALRYPQRNAPQVVLTRPPDFDELLLHDLLLDMKTLTSQRA